MNEQRADAAKWIHTAFKTAQGAFGAQLDWKREGSDIVKAQGDLDFYLGAYFYSEFETPSVTLQQVVDAWRVYWKLHLTGQQSLV